MSRRDRVYMIGIGLVVLASLSVMWFAWTLPGPTAEASDDGAEDEDAEAGAIAGQVVDIAGEPIASAQVRAGERTVQADDQGRFQFDQLAPGNWALDASAEGFLSPGPAAARVLEIELGDGSDDTPAGVVGIRLVLRRPGRILGQVVSGSAPAADVPIDAAWLFAEGVGGKLAPFAKRDVARSGADGRFEITGLAPGRLQLTVRGRAGVVRSRELSLADDAAIEGVILDLSPTGSISGVVTALGGGALAADIEVSGDHMKRPLRVRADAQGRYRVDAVPAGRVAMTARAQGRRSSARSLLIRPGQEEKVDFQLHPGAGIAGRVIDADDNPVRRAAVVVRSRGAETVVMTDQGGGFQLDPTTFHAASATVRAVTPWHTPSPEVRIPTGEELVLRVGPGGALGGLVVDGEGRPVSGALVTIAAFQSEGTDPFRNFRDRPSRTREDGRFELSRLRPGRYDLRADHPKFAAGFLREVWLNGGDRQERLRIVVGGGAVVRGRVTSAADRQPLAGVTVVLHEPGSTLPPRRTLTSADGTYKLEGLSAGLRTLRVQHVAYLTELSSGVSVPEQGEVVRDVALRKSKQGERFSFQGIGATLGQSSKGIFVRAIMADSPAGRFGLQNGDVITGVDFKPTTALGLSQVVELIRGEAGKPVTLDIDRPGAGPMSVTVERGQVTVKSGPKPPGHP
mgnify:CR=1 FL=1